jgi:transposase
MRSYRKHGRTARKAQSGSGRPRKLTRTQEKIICRWLYESPTEFGFPTDVWTAKRLALLIWQEFGVKFNSHYLCSWLKAHNITSQIPERHPRERNPLEIANWVVRDWPRIKKKRIDRARTLFS